MTPVRHATLEDIPRMVEIGEKFLTMSVNAPLGFDPVAVAALFEFMIEKPMMCLLTNDTGIMGGYIAPVYFNPTVLMADELFWYADERGMDLLKTFEVWAKDMGASRISFSCMENENVDRMCRVYARKGYESKERKMVKVM